MASNHPYKGHRENAVGHRRAKMMMQTGGYVAKRANGGKAVMEEPEAAACPEPDADDMPVAEGRKAGGRLDKKARGGKVEGFANGGMALHKITPSKRKPHVMININNAPRPRGGGLLAIKPPMPMPGLPRPTGMKTGGGVTKPAKLWGGAPYGGAAEGPGRLRLAKRKPMGEPLKGK